MQVFVDHRESKSGIAEFLEAKGVEVKVSQLSLGDFIVSDRVCVERKTRQDFEASIIDGRLFEQASRLSASYAKPVIIVEGERFQERVSRAALLGAVSSLMLDQGLSVFFTRDAEGTAEFIFALARREQLSEKRPLRLVNAKKAHILTEQQRMVVESLPGVGPKLARSLLLEFGSIEKLARAKPERLMKVEKVGEEKAKSIRRVLSERYLEGD